jgi:hypothetical protein
LLLPGAALAVHQLRYSLTYGVRTPGELAATGHVYLHSLVPWVVLALGIGFSGFLRRVAYAARTGETGTRARMSTAPLWALVVAGLIALYSVQELLEGFFASGHPGGVAGVFGHGGWRAIPCAAVVALAVVALLGVGRTIIRLAGRSAPPRERRRPRSAARPRATLLRPLAPLAAAAAGRAPPSTGV